MTYIWIIAIILLAGASLFYSKWRKTHSEKMFLMQIVGKDSGVCRDSVVRRSILICNDAIAEGLGALTSASAADACRNNRVFDTLCSGYNSFKTGNSADSGNSQSCKYLSHIWESSLKITEIIRVIATKPNFVLPASEAADVASLKDGISRLSHTVSNGDSADVFRQRNDDVCSSLARHIKQFSGLMSHSDYKDGSNRYEYLKLLNNIYTYLRTMQKLMSTLVKN